MFGPSNGLERAIGAEGGAAPRSRGARLGGLVLQFDPRDQLAVPEHPPHLPVREPQVRDQHHPPAENRLVARPGRPVPVERPGSSRILLASAAPSRRSISRFSSQVSPTPGRCPGQRRAAPPVREVRARRPRARGRRGPNHRSRLATGPSIGPRARTERAERGIPPPSERSLDGSSISAVPLLARGPVAARRRSVDRPRLGAALGLPRLRPPRPAEAPLAGASRRAAPPGRGALAQGRLGAGCHRRRRRARDAPGGWLQAALPSGPGGDRDRGRVGRDDVGRGARASLGRCRGERWPTGRARSTRSYGRGPPRRPGGVPERRRDRGGRVVARPDARRLTLGLRPGNLPNGVRERLPN